MALIRQQIAITKYFSSQSTLVMARHFPPPWSIPIIRQALAADARRAAAKRIYKSLDESGLKQTNVGKPAKDFAGKGAHIPVKTAAEYRAMAEECFGWAREAKANAVRGPLQRLAQAWLDAASKLDGLPATRTEPTPDEPSKTARSAD